MTARFARLSASIAAARSSSKRCRTEIATHLNHLVCDVSPVPSLELDVCCYRAVNAAIRRGKLARIYSTDYGSAGAEAVELRVFCSANVRQSTYPRR